ncbi:acetate/propionate family kinase [Jannaschia ovalis]|uniref:Acetate kinase n=1 Tax=Jannaschia ovalis TaxID=3038773 RepID=A0ABY8LAZ2_9RHOB|nr:acetate kinase [Jannaschia sp. GRR-S6-38]WGH78454.1 acetate kinase [Jannaschia sp. GRR-S6-38]
MMLVVNAGSSSVKFALYDADLKDILSGSVTEIGGAARLRVGPEEAAAAAPDHDGAIALILDVLAVRGHGPDRLTAAAHRVVHGGDRFTGTVRVTPEIIDGIAACIPLAPLHNPHNLAAIRALGSLAPDLPQVAGFDTAFHATQPEVERIYAIPAEDRARGLRRYGFHGISYAGLVDSLRAAGRLPRRLLALHLGNGASACAIRDGASVATTMGYSPTSGLTMGTRSGDIDPMAVLELARVHGIDGAAARLNRGAGLLSLGGASDMRALAARKDPAARLARAHFTHACIRHAGALIAAMGGLDAVAFTGGIGENDAGLRRAILDGLRWTGLVPGGAPPALHAPESPVAAWIVPAEEERTLARDARALLAS